MIERRNNPKAEEEEEPEYDDEDMDENYDSSKYDIHICRWVKKEAK